MFPFTKPEPDLMNFLFHRFLSWLPMPVLAIANGALRELVYKKITGELAAHQLSTVSLVLLFAFYMYFLFRKWPSLTASKALQTGGLWLLLTLAFEFGFGLYRGNSLYMLLHDYNLAAGRIWLFIPLWVCMAPYLFYRFNN